MNTRLNNTDITQLWDKLYMCMEPCMHIHGFNHHHTKVYICSMHSRKLYHSSMFSKCHKIVWNQVRKPSIISLKSALSRWRLCGGRSVAECKTNVGMVHHSPLSAAWTSSAITWWCVHNTKIDQQMVDCCVEVLRSILNTHCLRSMPNYVRNCQTSQWFVSNFSIFQRYA